MKYYPEEAINGSIPDMSLYDYLRVRNAAHQENIALNYYGHKISYRTLLGNIDLTAQAFMQMGVGEGDIVSLCVVNSPEVVYCIYALNKLGAVCNIIEPRTNAISIRDRINDCNSKVLIAVDPFFGKAGWHLG